MPEFTRLSALGSQFAEQGVPRGLRHDPLLHSQDFLDAVGGKVVVGCVGILLYRRSPELEVYLLESKRAAIRGEFVFCNDMGAGETYQEAIRRTCARYLGFKPQDDTFTEITTVSVQCMQGAHVKRPVHMLVVVLAYEMTDADIAEVAPNMTADGTPSTWDAGIHGRWVSPDELINNPRDHSKMLLDVLAKFMLVQEDVTGR